MSILSGPVGGTWETAFFFFFFPAGASGICVSTADEFIPTGADSAACSVNADSIISVFRIRKVTKRYDVFHYNDGDFPFFLIFSINTSAGWFYSLIISQSIN